MNTVRKLIYRAIIRQVLLVTVAFSALFFFIDFVEEVRKLGRDGYTTMAAVITCLYQQGAHFYDIFPVGLLIGAILALARLAQTSEYTILRTGGMGPGRALGLLGGLGLIAALITTLAGNWLVPVMEQRLAQHRASFGSQQSLKLGGSGTWLREQRMAPDGKPLMITVNVGSAISEDEFGLLRIFEFDTEGRLLRRITAAQARVEATDPGNPEGGSVWHLRKVHDTRWTRMERISDEAVLQGTQFVDESAHDSLDWESSLTPLVVAASVRPADTMSAYALWRYTQHLSSNAQAAQRYEAEFWKKTFYPVVCLVMVALALPFAYLHARAGGMSLKIFGGIMVGISFVLANHISSHLGLLHDWKPWLAAAAPSAFYLLLSLSAFAWLVRYR
ncbi:MAG TPA: LPS export ABC transporter permease LptG [Aquabacterium sp.]|nr:LPS export ABC transporter permease LptG [Aquabacterium sp.]